MKDEIKVSPSTGEILIGNKKCFGVDKDILDYITNLQKEVRINNDLIPYLKNKEKSLKKQIINLQEENKRLNNIINELEKWLKSEVERLMNIEQSNNVIFLIGAYTEVLDKIKGLKGSDK